VAEGNFTAIADLTGLTGGLSPQAGLLSRQGGGTDGAPSPTDLFAGIFDTSSGLAFEYRTAAGGSITTITSNAVTSLTTPVWLKLQRDGDEFDGFYSTAATEPVPADRNFPVGLKGFAHAGKTPPLHGVQFFTLCSLI
jgi:hypothetical protein